MRKRKPNYVPHQSKPSPQDVRDYSTPAGAAMANEEFRRLALAIESLQAETQDLRTKLREATQLRNDATQDTSEAESASVVTPTREESGIAVYHGSRYIGHARSLVFRDTLMPEIQPRVAWMPGDTVVIEHKLVRSPSGLPATKVRYLHRRVAVEGEPILDDPERDREFYAAGTYAPVPYRLEVRRAGMEWTDHPVHLRVDTDSVWNIQASLWVRAGLPTATAWMPAIMMYPRLCVMVSKEFRGVIDAGAPPYRTWRFSAWPPQEVRCPVGYHDIFLSGSINLLLRAGDEVTIVFACTGVYDEHGRLVELPQQRDGKSLLRIWGWYGNVTAQYVEAPVEDIEVGITVESDPFASATLLEAECPCVCRERYVIAKYLNAEFPGQTVFPLDEEVPYPELTRCLVNGVEYMPGNDYRIDTDTSSNRQYFVWQHNSISLSPEDTIVLHYFVEPSVGVPILGVTP